MKALLWPDPLQIWQLQPYVCSMQKQNQISQDMIRRVLLFIGIGIGLLIVFNEAKAQNQFAIYGRVTTVGGDKYTGAIKWGSSNAQKAEVFWSEILNGTKTSNNLLEHLSKKELEELSNKEEGSSWLNLSLDVLSIWDNKSSRRQHEFKVRFGDIKSIEPMRRDRAKITLKNGAKIEVTGSNSEDIGATIGVYDFELGEVKLSWSRVEKVDFFSTPKGLDEGFGKPIYGTVNAGRKGRFTGIIEWGGHERFDHETLDGKDRSGNKKIAFRNIKMIEKGRGGSDVTLNSGRKFFLTGTNDVNNENSGIVINDSEVGQIKIAWRDFDSIELSEIGNNGMSYDDFPASQGITGTVVTIEGDEYEGLIAYDLDESWEFELLDANDDNAEFQIPFRNIKSIVPKNSSYSLVRLKNGETLLLGEHRDVTNSNAGVLVFPSKNDDPIYIKWSKVDEIIFN